MKKLFREQIDNIDGLPFFNINFSNHNVYGIDFAVDSIDEYETLMNTLVNSEIIEAEEKARIYAEEVMAKSNKPYTGASKIKFIRKCVERATGQAITDYGERIWDFFDSLEISDHSNLFAIVYYKNSGPRREYYLEVFATTIDVANHISDKIKEKDDIDGVTIYQVSLPALQISSEMGE